MFNRYVLVETDHGRHCGAGNCTLIGDGTPNITALWQVEKIRHRDTSRGHAMELKLTIVPMRRNHAESKREIVSGSGGGGGGQLKARSFVVRDIDYPRYFDDNAHGLAPRNKIQKRTFDMFGMSQPLFDSYRIPLHYKYQNKYTDNLNTGEYYVSGEIGGQTTDRAFYQHPAPTIQYQSPTGFNEQQQLQRPHLIRFPTASAGSTNDYPDTGGTTSPFTATHLHHHFYMNKNNVPLVKATAFEKENLIEEHYKGAHIITHQTEPALQQNYSVDGFDGGSLSTAGYPDLSSLYKNSNSPSEHHIQHETHQSYQAPLTHTKNHQPEQVLQQNFSVDSFDGGPLNTIGFPPISSPYKDSYPPREQHIQHDTHQSYQTPFAQPDPVAVSPPSLYQHHQQYPAYVQPQLQLASPPHQQFYRPQQDISLTTAQYAPFQQHQLFAPIIDVHPRLNQIPLVPEVRPIQFQGSFKYEDDRFSDPDPMYHQQITTVTQHFNPHILPHLLPAYADPHNLFGQRFNINHGHSNESPGTASNRPQAPPPQYQPEQPMQVPPSPTEITPAEEEPTGKDNVADVQPESPTLQEGTIVSSVDVTEPSSGDPSPTAEESPTTAGDSPPTGEDSPPTGADSPTTDEDAPPAAGEEEQSDVEPITDNMEPIIPIDEITETKIENSSPPIEPSNDYGNMEQIDPNSKEVTSNFPDSINAQLPPPEQGEDLTVPYVDSSSIVPNLKPEKFQILVPSNNNHRTPLKPPYNTKASSTILQPVQTTPDLKAKRNRQRGYLPTKATTEKPILKWMPKRSKPTNPHRTESVISTVLTASTTVKPNVVIVTPTHDIAEEPRTSKSTSISFSSSASSTKPKLKRVQPKYKGFLPTVLPSSVVSLTQGNVTTINTNSSELKLFRASDEDDGGSNSGVDQHIARSIIKHAQNL